MHSDEIDIVAALTSLLETLREMEKLASKPLSQWATYSTTCVKFVKEGSGSTTEYYYQAQKVKCYVTADEYFVARYKDCCKGVSQCIKSRLEWSDLELMRDIIVVLNTQGWEKLLEESNLLNEVLRLVTRFKVPLQGAEAEAETSEIHREFTKMMDYAASFISLSTLEYRSVWWRLFNVPTKCDWRSALLLVQLLFSLPALNGTVERVFSLSNIIKTDRRSLLFAESFDDLLLLNSNKIPLTSFVADQAIDLWWTDKTRRPNQKPRKKYKKHSKDDKSSKVIILDDSEDSTPVPSSESEDDNDLDWLNE